MNIGETIKNIRATCDNYIDPNLLAFVIDDENYMKTNNILEMKGYGITDEDSYEEKLIKIHENENIFLPYGMMTFVPVLNECDIFSIKDYNLQLTQEEFDTYSDPEEKLFGILVKKGSQEYVIGKSNICSCNIDSNFEKMEESDCEFYKTIKEIIDSKIIY